MIKKFNFPIIDNELASKAGHEYFSLCQEGNPNTELYYYKSSLLLNELFTPVFGNFDAFLSKEKI